MRKPSRGVTAVLTCASVLLAPAVAQAGDAAVIRAVNHYAPAVLTADRATRASGGDPNVVQRQYDVARDFEEALSAAGSTSRGCRPLAEAANRLAQAEVKQAEGYDLPDPSVTATGVRQANAAVAQYKAVVHLCQTQPTPEPRTTFVLDSPSPHQAFFDAVAVEGRAPAGSAWAVVTVDQRMAGCQAAGRRAQISGGRVSLSLPLSQGPHTLKVAFCAAAKGGGQPRQLGTAVVPNVWALSLAEKKAAPPTTVSGSLSARIAQLSRKFPGISGIWYHDLSSGTSASWNADAQFPAASTVKLGLLVTALDRFGLSSPVSYDITAMATWSSNLATNRLLVKVGGSEARGAAAAQAALARMGATRSTFTGGYRVGTAFEGGSADPPRISSRVTTAHDLGTILYFLQSGALGKAGALKRLHLTQPEAQLALGLLLSSEPKRDNIGLFRPALGKETPAAQKQGWFSVVRHTAAIVYTPEGPKIVVLLTYAPDLTLLAAQAYGGSLIRLLRL